METSNYFDTLFAEHHSAYANIQDFISPNPIIKRERDAFFEFADMAEGVRVLDFGCGTGSYTIPLLMRGYRVTAIDVSKVSLEMLNDTVEKLGVGKNLEKTVCGPLSDYANEYRNYFDYVVFVDVLHHVTDIEKTIRDLLVVVKEGGSIIGIEPNGKFPLWPLYGLFKPYFHWKEEKGLRRCRVERFRSIFKTLHLEDFRYRYWSFMPGFVTGRMPFLLKLDDFLMKVRSVAQFAGFIMVKAKKPISKRY
jgi:SAM-dependent methyltransferase